MSSTEVHFVSSPDSVGYHRLALRVSGPPDAGHTVVCLHGLTRNAHDFDTLAANLVATPGVTSVRVICVDMPGRGRSDWLTEATDYGYAQYIVDASIVVAWAGGGPVDIVGTSMGGLIGMFMAARAGTPVRRLVMNDVGPVLPHAALARIAAYVGNEPTFASPDEAERHLREIHASFGPLTDAQWRHLARHSFVRRPDGSYGFAYDPRIGQAFTALPDGDIDLWAVWDRLACPVLVLHGARSDLLTVDILREMERRGPGCRAITFEECGHAPALMADHQVAVVSDWLLGKQPTRHGR